MTSLPRRPMGRAPSQLAQVRRPSRLVGLCILGLGLTRSSTAAAPAFSTSSSGPQAPSSSTPGGLGTLGFDSNSVATLVWDILGEETSKLGFPKEVIDSLLFDSVEDLDSILTRSEADRAQHWFRFFPSLRELELQVMQWTSPSLAFRPNGMLDTLKEHFQQARLETCKARCGSAPIEECCSPKAACMTVKTFMESLYLKTDKLFKEYLEDATRRFKAAEAAAWPFGHGSTLLPLMGAARVMEDVIRALTFLMSRYPSSPNLRSCLETKYGQVLRESSIQLLELWRIFSQKRDWMTWEILATSRMKDFNWGQLGHQQTPLEELWHWLSNMLIHLKRFVHWSHLIVSKDGWRKALARDRGFGPAEFGATGEYEGLLLKRAIFRDQWHLDKGIVRFLMANLFRPGETLGEFGAFGGHYSKWFNDTGIIQSFAFDGISGVGNITQGAVQELQLSKSFNLGRTFDWIMCMEVGEHLHPGTEDTLLRNIARHARIGAIISWATPDYPSPHHPNTMTLEQSAALIARHGFTQDVGLTAALREASQIEWLKQTVGIYYLHGGDRRR